MQFTKLTNKTKTNMYTSKTITRPDGTQYVKCIRVNDQPSIEMTDEQKATQRWLNQYK
jgi:hypothetical protein